MWNLKYDTNELFLMKQKQTKKTNIYIHTFLNHFAVQQKLTQH